MVAVDRYLAFQDAAPVAMRPEPILGGAAKRAADILIALPVLALLSPVMLAIALAVKLEDRGPALFAQPRVGRGGVPFRCLKFRSMVTDAERRMHLLLRDDPEAAREWAEKQKITKDPRVTAVGRFLRHTSLDELPQFFNVLLGDMSVVGPRPMLRQQIAPYGSTYNRYCQARPGITGLWQVSGRNQTTFKRRSELDEIYLTNWSLLTDLRLMFRTVAVVLLRRGAC